MAKHLLPCATLILAQQLRPSFEIHHLRLETIMDWVQKPKYRGIANWAVEQALTKNNPRSCLHQPNGHNARRVVTAAHRNDEH
ncbi:hypothetical protein L195_g058036 [Trifolium pratense]|uniref:Uncharacterized protein n=1 Tax=Trifolium pratense TaxID=57577 RepID=A0A2K3JPX9_TRIPR|nr:hypothetical protein L195_g058036 [Trifolium pratense]